MSEHPHGPFDAYAWPEKLAARVVTPGPSPQVHGYEVETDLARHYRFSDLIYLGLTGELPDDRASLGFELALLFAAPVPVTHAPTHAALLARICCVAAGNIFSVAAATLGTQARHLLERHRLLLAWLERPEGSPPSGALSSDEPDRAAVDRLAAELDRRGIRCAVHDSPFSREAALLVLLHACGIRQREAIESALVLAGLPLCVAEAMAVAPCSMREYPANLTPFLYVEESNAR